MNPQFKTGYKCNLYFYTAICIANIIMGFVNQTVSIWLTVVFIPYAFFSIICLNHNAKKENVNYTTYAKMQSIAFVITDMFLSISFDSAQVFIYAMCFTSILSFVFIDVKLSKFQLLMTLIIAIIAAGVISIYTGSTQTMASYSFGTVLLVVMNWVIVSMTSHINFQYRKSDEQERSLDDMLKVVEVKCEEAQAATRSKTLFLAHMSHEIRTPINVIVGMNEMILRESRDSNISEYASETKNAAKSLLGIINDILDITKIEVGKLTSTPVEYETANLITDIFNLVRFKAEDKGLKLILKADENLPSKLKGDDIRLKQIVINLLTNAVKYTHKGSITLDIHPVGNDEIFFGVKDTGIGIKEDDINRLFNAFERIEERKNRNIEGTGLGLNITSSLLKMFGSELKVTSVYGKGSEFYFTIKQQVVDATPVGKINLKAKNYNELKYHALNTAPDAKVLIVDDNEMNRKVFKNLLKNTAVKITEAASGKECLKLVAETKFDIIFMDYMMPEMDGVQTLHKMKQMEDNLSSNAPVIVLTANAVAGAKEFYEESGFDGFLSKPVSPKKLEHTLFSNLDKKLIKESAAEEEKDIELPVVNGVDWDYARLHFENNRLLSDTVRMFLTALKRDADELGMYFDSIENEEALAAYRVKVHSMKSSAALIGIVQLSGMAMELEEAARSLDADTIKSMHPVFIKRWLSYEQLLAEFAVKKTADKKAEEHKESIDDIIERIHTAAAEMDVDKLDDLSAELDGYSFNADAAEKVSHIKDMIFNFDIEGLKNCTL